MSQSRAIAVLTAGLAFGWAAGALAAETSHPSAQADRIDPYKNFKFRLQWEGRYVAGFAAESPVIVRDAVVKHRAGGDPSTSHKSPGRSKYEPIALERGLTQDSAFAAWAADSARSGGGSASAIPRKDVRLEVHDGAGGLTSARSLRGCRVSQYQAPPELNARGPGVAIQSLMLECEASRA